VRADDHATRHIYFITYVVVTEQALVALLTDLPRALYVIVLNLSERTRNLPSIEGQNITDGRQSSGSRSERCLRNKTAI
jgi:hypothetical protein